MEDCEDEEPWKGFECIGTGVGLMLTCSDLVPYRFRFRFRFRFRSRFR
ncbi:hypothetical protein L195_g032350 [Trifolium pratense]|uniref:Uncharacterized protein n=1 Tax=Trifolium pratense TaxID=57577 RepID=A0A2K3LCY5_TRIPR|nr:hypothetical protein L195_g032350 [Trifolium pratense]